MQTLINIIIFGSAPTYLALLQKDWMWWLGYVIVVFAYYTLNRIITNISSSLNIIIAKITYSKLSEDDQIEVYIVAEQILAVYECDPTALFESEFQQFGYSALAMRNLGISPDTNFDHWFDVKNPSKVPPEKWIAAAIRTIEVNLAPEHDSNATH